MPISWNDRSGLWSVSALDNGAAPAAWFAGFGVRSSITKEWYVSPNGLAGNTGSITSPWDLQTALNQPASVHAGDIIWLRGGTYTGTFTTTLQGTAARPIIVRQYPLERATINGNVVNTGTYVWLWGPEVVSPTPGTGNANGVQSRSVGSKYINLVVHDAAGAGIALFDDIGGTGPKPDQEAYGCITYNNGNSGTSPAWAPGLYVNNATGYRRVRDNITFNNTAFGMQVYGTVGNVNNDFVDGNIAFGNGSTSAPVFVTSPSDILVGGGATVTGAVVTANYVYRTHVGAGNALEVGYYFQSTPNADAVVRRNYVYGLMEVFEFASMAVQDNVVYSLSTDYSVGGAGLLAFRGDLSGWKVGGNAFYGLSTASAQFGYGPPGVIPGTAYTFDAWRTATGLTLAPGLLYTNKPPNKVVVRPNAYEKGRANIVVFNWSGLSLVPVDLTNVLEIGQAFVIRNVQDLFGTPAVVGTYGGGTVNVPMAGITAPTLTGGRAGSVPPVTGPTFQAFVVEPYPILTDFGINFRDTAAYVTDPANTTYALGIEGGNFPFGPYPQLRLGFTFGWESGPDIASRDRDNTIDHRLAGLNSVPNGGANQCVFRIDLPASGKYTLHLAAGDQSFADAVLYVQVLDDQTPILTINSATLAGHFIDATGVDRTSAADWVTNEAGLVVTIRSRVLRVKVGHPTNSTGSSNIAHIRVVPS